MSLHQLANHMSARGRGPDSTLVHMSPREVEGLQKLAVAHGTSLTINPDTGLPEAFSLKDLLPTLAGAALNYFAPGVGTAIGGVLGLSGAAGTGLAVGAATAAISGDLGKGLQAGLGAYGGAGITDTLVGMGAGQLGAQAMEEGVGQKLSEEALQNSVANRMASATMSDKLGAGLSFAGSNPMTALKTGAKYLGAAASPAIFAGDVGNTVPTVTPRRPSTPISNEKFDPYSQTFERNQPRSNDGYDPYAQLYSRSAAKGGLMSLAHGGAVHYEGGGPVGAAAAPFDEDAWLRNYIATNYPQPAAPVVTNTNAGSGFAATPAAPVAETAPLAAAQVSPQAGAGIAALSNAQAAPATPVAETAPAPVAQVSPQQFSPPDFFDTSQAAQDVRRTFAEQLAKNNANNTGIAALSQAPVKVAETAPIGLNNALANAMSAGTGMTVQDAATKVLGRQLTPTELSNWQDKLGSDVNAAELSRFSVAAQPERGLGVNYTDSNKAIRDMYLERLGRYPDASGLAYFSNKFGPTVEAGERAIFDAMTTEEFNANAEQKRKGLTTVVTDLTTADTEYIAPGGGGATGASQIGGGTTINPNGTITTSPVIPGIPVGGFKGMTGVQKAYTDGGGNLGYTTTFVPTTTAEFDAKYSNTGYSKKMYDYLRGKGPKPTKMTDVDETGKETYREIMRPYKEAVLGVPVNTNTKLNWNKETGKYDRNRDYVRQKTITDPVTKEKSVRNYMSINNATAALTDKPYTIKELMSWADRSFVDDETLSQATGLKPFELQKLRYDADEAGATPEKKVWVKSKAVAKGGLMSLANGGAVHRFNGMSGSAVGSEYIDSTTGDKYILDNRYGGGYRKEKVTKDGLNYTWDRVSNSYKLAGADSGIAGLMDMSGNGPPAGGENAPNTTPNYGVLANIGKSLSDMGLETFGGYLSQQAREGRTGQQGIPTDIQDSSRDDTRGPVDRNAVDAPNPAEGGPAPAAPTSDTSDPTGADTAPADFAANGGMMGHYAQGGLGSLGGYSDGGRLLRGPGDGVSDSIPASIGDRQPARLADGEFVVPARIVSELGNGSTEAGARALYKMMDRIQANRRKTTGKNSVAVDSKAHKYLPA